MAFKRRIDLLEGRGMTTAELLHSCWEILNSKHQISPYRACGVVGRAHGNKFQYLNPKFKTNIFLKKKAFLIFEFWYLILFRISDLGLRILHLNKEG